MKQTKDLYINNALAIDSDDRAESSEAGIDQISVNEIRNLYL